MRTIITSTKPATSPNAGTWVDYRGAIGNGTALWAGRIPTPGQEYEVELEIDGSLGWGTDITIAPAQPPQVTSTDSEVRIHGVVDATDDTDWAAIRLGSSIMMIQTEGKPFEPGTFVELRARRLTLHDTYF